jgi:predicted amino acid racemase
MFLKTIISRNPELLKAAVSLHQDRVIPTNTWVFDLDTIRDNAKALYNAKIDNGLETYLMTKQHNRNPFINKIAMLEGLHATVCVDQYCCHMMGRYDVKVGHVGHLNQIPSREIEYVLRLHPEVWTVYCIEQAKAINHIAEKLGVKQDILLRIYREGDLFFSGQEGGFRFDSFLDKAIEIQKLRNVNIVGTVSFPCFKYNGKEGEVAEPSPNMMTIVEAAELLSSKLGIEINQINAPGNTSSITFPILKKAGATHVEPGHGLLGTTPNHRLINNLPERPAYCYVSEITHKYESKAYAHGGGLFQDIFDPNFEYKVLVGKDPEKILKNDLTWERCPQIIDYHAPLTEGGKCEVGDTAVFGFRSQLQMTRSWIAIIQDLQKGKPKLVGLFDNACNMVDPVSLEVVPIEVAQEQITAVVADYSSC